LNSLGATGGEGKSLKRGTVKRGGGGSNQGCSQPSESLTAIGQIWTEGDRPQRPRSGLGKKKKVTSPLLKGGKNRGEWFVQKGVGGGRKWEGRKGDSLEKKRDGYGQPVQERGAQEGDG